MDTSDYRKYIKYKTKYIRLKGGKKKYQSRNSPPYPAQKCPNKKKIGNDGKMYSSIPKYISITFFVFYNIYNLNIYINI